MASNRVKTFKSFKPFKTFSKEWKPQREIEREKKNQEGYAVRHTSCGAGDAMWRVVSPLLGCGRNGSGALRLSASSQSTRRRPGVVSRSIRQSWTTRRALPASRSFVGVRRYRRWWIALPLPRLVVQRSRPVLGDAGGAEGQQVLSESETSVLSCEGTGRSTLRIHGTGQRRSTAPAELCAAHGANRPVANRAGASRRIQLVQLLCKLRRPGSCLHSASACGIRPTILGQSVFQLHGYAALRVRRNGLRYESRHDQTGSGARYGVRRRNESGFAEHRSGRRYRVRARESRRGGADQGRLTMRALDVCYSQ